MFRRAQKSDLPGLIRIFMEAFGDPEDFAKMTLEKFTGLENVYLAERETEIVASLCAVPVTLKGMQGAYFYAVCTDERFRGQGIMTGLMEWAENELKAQGKRFVTLIPAEAGLFDFYGQRGYQKAFEKRIVSRDIRNNLWAVADFDTVTVKTLEQLRKKYAPDSVTMKTESNVCALTDLYSGGLTIVSTERAYGLYFYKDEEARFIELFAETDRDAEYLMEAARQKDRVEHAQIELSRSQNTFLGEGSFRDYAMIRFLGEPFGLEDCYMRLMMDNV